MCRHCDPDYDDWNIESLNIDLGNFGEHTLDFLISKKKKAMEISFGPISREYLWEDEMEISYCPFCGEKL